MSRQALQGHENGDIEYDPELLILVVEDALVIIQTLCAEEMGSSLWDFQVHPEVLEG